MSPDVSVIIPCLNAEAFLYRSVQSALDQESCRVEVIIIDDGSTDGTWEKALRLASSDSRIRLLRLGQNKGVSHARNIGMNQALGAWIAILDADDRFLPGRLIRMLSAAEQMDADIVLDHLRGYNREDEEIWSPLVKNHASPCRVSLEEYLYHARPFTGKLDWGLLQPILKRDFLAKSSMLYPEDKNHGEDFLFMMSLFKQGARCVLIPETGYEYTLRSSGWSRTRIDYAGMVNDCLKLSLNEKKEGRRTTYKLLCIRASSLYVLIWARLMNGYEDYYKAATCLLMAFRHPILLIGMPTPLLLVIAGALHSFFSRMARIRKLLIRRVLFFK
jgi:succinoglycan biosynthesis protein ExoO